MRCATATALLALAASAATGCNEDAFSEPMTLGGKRVSAEVLNDGRKSYLRYCVGCHGREGDGAAPSSATMVPAPRDFTKGLFKFDAVPGRGLPTDADLLRTLRRGLEGTHMPGWPAMKEREAVALIQYIKTFSPRWREEQQGERVQVGQDPYSGGSRTDAVRRGESVYHALGQCWTCHPSYVSRERILQMTREVYRSEGREAPGSIPLRDDLHRPRGVVCAYGKVLPPDFLEDTLRASRDARDLAYIVAAGIGGTPMPSWYEELSKEDLWALAYYVDDLVRSKGTPRAAAIRRRAGHPQEVGSGR